MLVGADIDGTLDSDPVNMASLLSSLRANGHRVAVLTGASAKKPTAQDLEDKAHYLKQLGMGSAYDQLVVFGDPPHKAKAKWCKKHGVALLFDNDAKNARFASKYSTVLLPWNSVEPPGAVKPKFRPKQKG